MRAADDAWASRGRVRREVAPEIVAALKRTYRTGQVGVIPVRSPSELAEARAFIVEARRYARQIGNHVRVATQPRPHEITTELRFRLVDRRPTQ